MSEREGLKRKMLDSGREFFECSVCQDVPRDGPVIQCKYNGHLMCSACEARCDVCPMCRDPLDKAKKSRNLAIEKLLKWCYHPCQHNDCEFKAKSQEIGLHEKKCRHRMVYCPDTECQESVKFGHAFEHVKAHIRPGYLADGVHRLVSRIPAAAGDGMTGKSYIVVHENTHFVNVFTKREGTFHAFSYILGDSDEAEKFTVTIAVGAGAQSQLIHRGKVFPLGAKANEIVTEKSGVLSFSPALAESFSTDVRVAAPRRLHKRQLEVHFMFSKDRVPMTPYVDLVSNRKMPRLLPRKREASPEDDGGFEGFEEQEEEEDSEDNHDEASLDEEDNEESVGDDSPLDWNETNVETDVETDVEEEEEYNDDEEDEESPDHVSDSDSEREDAELLLLEDEELLENMY